jgi:hypothetical protein
MSNLQRFPLLVLIASFLAMWLFARFGVFLRKRKPNPGEDTRRDLDMVVTATLTLLGLIIGFTFSMAITRYDQRKVYEEAEANAIGTEYIRADLLPPADAARVRLLLKDYLGQRILFYKTHRENDLRKINDRTSQLQMDLWSAAEVPSAKQPTPVLALVVSGMNDVLNAQGYTQAAWWNRIPIAAWGLMLLIALFANMGIGYDSRGANPGPIQFLVLPLILAIAFFLIADIDSPRSGVIRVLPQNLLSLSQSLEGH